MCFFHKQVTNVSQQVFVIILWGIFSSNLTLPFRCCRQTCFTSTDLTHLFRCCRQTCFTSTDLTHLFRCCRQTCFTSSSRTALPANPTTGVRWRRRRGPSAATLLTWTGKCATQSVLCRMCCETHSPWII